MSDNPFAEPDDPDRTVVRGPQRAAQPSAAAAPAYTPAAAPPLRPAGGMAPAMPLAGEAESIPKVGMGPLAAAAAPLLDLLSRIAAGVHAADPGEVRRRAERGLQQFDADARAAGCAEDEIRQANYALCAALDDVALASAWGPGSAWSTNSLVSFIHHEVRAGENFYTRLEEMQRNPGQYRQALEIYYLCLALGFQGRYRLPGQRNARIDQYRDGLYQILVQIRGAWERELSPRWRGVDAPHRVGRGGVPTWVSAVLCLFILGAAYAWVSNALAGRSDDLFARLAQLPPGAMPTIQRVAPPQPPAPPPPPPPRVDRPVRPDLATRLKQFLAPEIQQGLVSVFSDPNRTTVRILNKGMFASGSATLDPKYVDLMNRIGNALKEEPGAVLVVGHSDNQPIRTARFPNNFALSAARAQAAMQVIATAEGNTPGRFTAEGRGEAEPIADNATAAGREANRRIEVVVMSGGSR